ncbi:MAG: RdgB/HAM1 family non-canonical purine NTP pyrophosphatase [Candidatus Aminicenantes bacterium]|nr:RdgB/HAM1 family non-canonical purine NTP pyrophosphatase [Candidatus Aminicenantes bacterium]
MNSLLLATRNPGKKLEIQKILQDLRPSYDLISLDEANIHSPVDECGTTFMENARLKADFYSRLSGLDTLGDDSGLEVMALNNRPGVFSARYAGEGASDDERIAKLLAEMIHCRDRRARFVSALCLSRAGRTLHTFTGLVRGEILYEKKGNHGFGYDPLFYYSPLKKTFAELSLDEKNRVSHRAQALRQLKKFIAGGGLAKPTKIG